MINSNHIKHLYARAGFGLNSHDWEIKRNWTINKAVNDLFESAKQARPLIVDFPQMDKRPGQMSVSERSKFNKEQRKLVVQYASDWLLRMTDKEGSPLIERMSLFWHGHFACAPKAGFLAQQQLQVLRTHGLGNFKDLLLGITKDVGMIRYLNNQQNKKNAPNENFTRELLELFTIGHGHYTENDIKEGARAFTGWSSNLRGEFVFRFGQHDFGSKSFMGKEGNFNGEDIIDIILKKEETAQNITRKIYKYFVSEKIDEKRVLDLSKKFYGSNYDIGALMKDIFTSEWFYTEEIIGSKIKSPVDLLTGLIIQLNLKLTDPLVLMVLQRGLGQVLFNPPNVAGWPGGKAWIDNATLLLRLNIPKAIYTSSELSVNLKADLEKEKRQKIRGIQATIDIRDLMDQLKDRNAEAIYDWTADYLLNTPPNMENTEMLKFLDSRNRTALIKTMCLRLMSLPEYQMC